MQTINIVVRKEVVACLKCKTPNQMLYLSDFAYGERLVLFYDNDKAQYAYINLLEDELFNTFNEMLREILKKHNVKTTKEQWTNIFNNTFGITCDEINGHKMNFGKNKIKCENCLSYESFGGLLLEPETLVTIEVPVITHDSWILLDENKKMKCIENELVARLR